MFSLGLDIGSSSVKAALTETYTGKKIAFVQEPKDEMEILSVHPSWAEQDPNHWWKIVCIAIKKLLQNSGVNASQVQRIGIAYQMHGLVVVDESGDCLRNSIIWCDSRAVSIGEKAYQDLGAKKCMNHLLNSPANFTASKLKWVKENEPHIYEKIHKYMLPGDYIAYKFSGEMTTTINGLSEGTIWDFKSQEVAQWLFDYYNIDSSMTPTIVPNFVAQCLVNKKGAQESGLKEGTLITYRAGDQPNNAFSLHVINPGEVAATGGTSGVVYALTDKLQSKEHQRINHFAHINYSKESPIVGKLLCINGAGIQYRWMKNNTGANSYEEMNQLAAKQDIGSDGLLVYPFGNGAERMLNNQNINARYLNLNLNQHDLGSMYRATLEGIAFSFVYGIKFIEDDNFDLASIKAGNDNLFQSDVFSQTIATLVGKEIQLYNITGAIGAARASSTNVEDLDAFVKMSTKNDYFKSFTPEKDSSKYEMAFSNWTNELEKMIK